MAFPIAPSVGETYTLGNIQYEWNGVAWDVSGSVSGDAVALKASTTYVDSQDSLLVSKSGDTMTGNLEAPSISIGGNYVSPYGRKNLLINGGFDIWKRGENKSVASGKFFADRWYYNTGGTSSITASKYREGSAQGIYEGLISAQLQGNASSYKDYRHRIEDCVRLSGKTLTLSFLMVSDSVEDITIFTRNVYSSTDSTSFVSSIIGQTSGFLTKYTYTFTVPSYNGETIDESNSIELVIRHGSASGTVRLAQVQLEQGSVATPFEVLPIGETDMLCKRYYQIANFRFRGYGFSAGRSEQSIFINEMRVTPSISDIVINSRTGFWDTLNATVVSLTNNLLATSTDASNTIVDSDSIYGGIVKTDAEIY